MNTKNKKLIELFNIGGVKLLTNKQNKKVAIFAIFFGLLVAFTFLLTNASNNHTDGLAELGFSSEDSDSALLDLHEQGSLTDKNLEVVLELRDDIYYVKMIAPPLEPQNITMSLGESSQEHHIETKEVPRNGGEINGFSLGFSDSSEEPDESNELAFNAHKEGDYVFELLGFDLEVIEVVNYGVRGLALPGTIQLDYTVDEQSSKKSFFRFYDRVDFDLTYSPATNSRPETLDIILPPFMSIGHTPQSIEGKYTVVVDTIKLSETGHYEDVDSALLKEYANSNNIYVKRIRINMAADFTEALTFNTYFYNSDTNITGSSYTHINNLMVKYGVKYDKVPFKFVAQATYTDTGGTIGEAKYLVGDSTLKNADGTTAAEQLVWSAPLPATHRTVTPVFYLRNGRSYFMSNVFREMAKTGGSNWSPELHYPVTNVAYYLSIPDSRMDVTVNEYYEKVIINGEMWYKSKPTNFLLNKYTSFLPSTTAQYLPTKGTMYPGQIFDMGEVRMDYTYKGVDYKMLKVYEINDFSVPAYYTGLSSYISNFIINTAAGPDASKRYQAHDGDVYKVDISRNTSSDYTFYSKMTDYNTETTFPFEYSPKSMNLNSIGTQSETTGTWEYQFPTIIYKYYGDDALYSHTMTGPTTSGSTSHFAFPDTANGSKRIESVTVRYNQVKNQTVWGSPSSYSYTILSLDKNISGAILPDNYPVEIKNKITYNSEENNATGIPSINPKTLILDKPFTLVKKPSNVPEDTLCFNVPKDSYYGYSYDQAYFLATGTGAIVDGSTGNRPYFGWGFATKNSGIKMIDYEDVKITINADSEDEKKAMSLMSGIYYFWSNTNNLYEKREVYYTTNKDLTPKLAIEEKFGFQAPNNSYGGRLAKFKLTAGEYATSVTVDIGKISGSAYGSTDGLDHSTSNVISMSSPTSTMLRPFYQNQRNFYNGSSEEVPITNGQILDVSATISTSTYAKHINGQPADPNYYNDTAKGKIKIDTTGTGTVSRSNYFENWNKIGNDRAYLQNDSISFDYKFYSAINTNTIPAVGLYPYQANIYFEVDKYFDLVGVGNGEWSLASKKSLANGNQLYTFTGQLNANNQGNTIIPLKFYVRPDTPILVGGSYQVIKNMGQSFDNADETYFKNKTGDDAYYLDSPYAIINTATGVFPAAWGITDQKLYAYTLPTTTSYPTVVTIGKLTHADIKMSPEVEGISAVESISFEEHQKNNVGVTAYLNVGASPAASYTARFFLPTKGIDTISQEEGSGGSSAVPNDDTLYLTGEPAFNNGVPGVHTFKYFKADGVTEVDVSGGSFDDVRIVELSVTNFVEGKSFALDIPLESRTVKLGKDIDDRAAHVGAQFKINAQTDYNVSRAAKLIYRSYTVNMTTGIDRMENGTKSDNLPDGIVNIKVYAKNIAEPVYEKSNSSLIMPKVNSDVEKIVVSINDNYRDRYRITVPNANPTLVGNSKFPVDSANVYASELEIKYEDLKNHRTGLYNLNLAAYLTVRAQDYNIYHKIPYKIYYSVIYKDNGATVPAALANKYTVSLSMTDSTIAAPVVGTNNMVVGLKKGEITPYAYTITNTLGDKAVGRANLTVRPFQINMLTKYVLSPNSILLAPTDTFETIFWPDKPNNTTTSATVLAGINTTNYASPIDASSKLYGRVTNMPEGYVIDLVNSKITYSDYDYNSNTNVSGELTITPEKDADGVYRNMFSVEVPIPFYNEYNWYQLSLEGAISFANRSSTLTIEKQFADGAINLEPNKDYDIKLISTTVPATLFDGQLKVGGSQSVSGLKFGHTYTIEETLSSSYKLDEILAKKVDGQTAALTFTQIGPSKYQFTVNTEIENGKIVLVNRLVEGGGIKLDKTALSNGINGEEFAFKLVGGPNGPSAASGVIEIYGYADFTTSTTGGTETVIWYDKVDKTASGGKTIDTSSLPVGGYKLTEIATTGRTNFIFGSFAFTGPNITVVSDGLLIDVLEAQTTPRNISVVNSIKEKGKVTLQVEFEDSYTISDTVSPKFDIIKADGSTESIVLSKNAAGKWESVLSNRKYGAYEIGVLADGLDDYDVTSFSVDSATVTRAVPQSVKFKLGELDSQHNNIVLKAKLKVKSIGELVIEKTVSGENTMPNQTFDFTVTDPHGKATDITLKVGEQKKLTGLLLGKYTVTEKEVEDFNHIGLEINAAPVAAGVKVDLNILSGNPAQTIKSSSSIKADASITIHAVFVDSEDKPNELEEFVFQLQRSINDGPWEIPSTPEFQEISLKIGDSHTFTNLPRGAKYRVVATNSPLFPYEVREIIINSGAGASVNERELHFLPIGKDISTDGTFMLDIKRLSIIIDKHFWFTTAYNPSKPGTEEGYPMNAMKVEGAQFTVYRYDAKDELHTVKHWTQVTNGYGYAEIQGLSAGRYRLVETKVPKGYKILARSIDFEVHNNNQTGEIFVHIDSGKLSKHVVFDSSNNIFRIPNALKMTNSNDGDGEIDQNPLQPKKPESPAAIVAGIISGILPNAGGASVGLLVIPGAVLIAAGIILRKKKNKKDDE